jgi:tol-pal system protein YbgF
VLLVASVGLAAGCGGAGSAVQPDAAPQEQTRAAEALRQRNQELAAQVRELRARLALGEAELRELRSEHACDEERPKTVRIRPSGGSAAKPQALPWEGGEPDDGRPRPVLRLYGQRASEPGPVPEVPEGLPDRLPVAPLPDAPAAWGPSHGATPTAPPSEGAGTEDGVREAYRAGLALIQRQQFAEAATRFASLLERHPRHAVVPDALYWRAEALYALRRYEEALHAFTTVVRDHGGSPRRGEAMFKMGLCEKRLGRPRRARAIFERVQHDFPGTVAARMAAQEDPS